MFFLSGRLQCLRLWVFFCSLQHIQLGMKVSKTQSMKAFSLHFTMLEDKTVLLQRQCETVLENDSSSIQFYPLDTTK